MSPELIKLINKIKNINNIIKFRKEKNTYNKLKC